MVAGPDEFAGCVLVNLVSFLLDILLCNLWTKTIFSLPWNCISYRQLKRCTQNCQNNKYINNLCN